MGFISLLGRIVPDNIKTFREKECRTEGLWASTQTLLSALWRFCQERQFSGISPDHQQQLQDYRLEERFIIQSLQQVNKKSKQRLSFKNPFSTPSTHFFIATVSYQKTSPFLSQIIGLPKQTKVWFPVLIEKKSGKWLEIGPDHLQSPLAFQTGIGYLFESFYDQWYMLQAHYYNVILH